MTTKTIVVKAEVRRCVECGCRTIGSIGAAGIYWPMLCQSCKDFADGMALTAARCAAVGLTPCHVPQHADLLVAVDAESTPPLGSGPQTSWTGNEIKEREARP